MYIIDDRYEEDNIYEQKENDIYEKKENDIYEKIGYNE